MLQNCDTKYKNHIQGCDIFKVKLLLVFEALQKYNEWIVCQELGHLFYGMGI